MNTRRNKKRPRKHRRKTRSRRQKGGDNEEYYTEELVEAIELGDIDNVISTLEQGADVNTRTQDTPILLRSVLHGDVEIVKILLKQPDIDVNAQQGDNRGATALIKALRSLKYSQRYEKTKEIINLLLKDKRTDVSIDTVYSTALNAAMHNKAPPEIIDLIKERVERKKNIAMTRLVTGKAELEDGRDLVPVAKRDVATSISRFFGGKRKTRKNHRNFGGKKSKRKTRKTRSKRQRGGGEQEDNLFKAAQDNNLDKAREALEKGADVNAKNNVRYQARKTALMLASSKGHPEMVNYLLQNGADVHAKDNNGWTALMRSNESEIVAILLAAGADVNAKNNNGETALIMSSMYGANPEVVRILLENGADVNAKTNDGKTAFLWASVLSDRSKDPHEKATYIEIEKLLTPYIVKETLPKHLERQQNRLNVGRVMDSKKMPGDLTHKIITEHFGGKRKTRKSKPKKRNRRSRKRAGADGDDSYDEGETTRESISRDDEPFYADDIEAIPLANEVHELEMANLDDSWASHSSFNPNESFINPYESDESLESLNLTPN